MNMNMLDAVWTKANHTGMPTLHVWRRSRYRFLQLIDGDWLHCRVSYDVTPEMACAGWFVEGDPGIDLYISRDGRLAIQVAVNRAGRHIVRLIDDEMYHEYANCCLTLLRDHDFSPPFSPEIAVYI